MTKEEIKKAKKEMQNTREYFELEKHRIPRGFIVEIKDDNVTQRLMVNGVSVSILAGTALCNLHKIEGVLDALDKLSKLQSTIKPDPTKIAIVMHRGLIEDVVSNQPIDKVVIVDDDLEDVDDKDIKEWSNGRDTFEAYFYSGSFSYNPELMEHLYEIYNKD